MAFPLLGAFAKSRKSTVCFVMSVCPLIHPFVLVDQLGFHWTDFHEIWYLSISRTSVAKIQVSLKSDKNKGYFTWRPMYIFDHISLISSYNAECFQLCRKNQNTRFMSSNFFFENLIVYEITWKNILEPDRPQMLWRTRVSCYIPKATDTHSE